MKTIVSPSAKLPKARSSTAIGYEEDDLDVEQDEEHRDQVEADPEAEPALDLRGQAALVGVLLVRDPPARAEDGVEDGERPPTAPPRMRNTIAGR